MNGRNGHEPAHYARLKDAVRRLAKERHAVILAHNYQEGAIQDAADFTGDSLNLARYAQTTEADIILFCGVHFMAETATMLNPTKLVLMPDLAAGCALADMVAPEQIRRWRREHPEGVVVCYINTSAAVKAESDLCCTSTNAVAVVESVPADHEILFVPDYYLGTYVKAKTKRENIRLWKGYCPAHTVILPGRVDALREAHPDAEFLMHPECGCLTKQMDLADQILSTEGMVRYVKESPAQTFIIATEQGILYRMRKDNPGKTFLPASDYASCHYMQRNTLDKVFRSLVTLQYPVRVDPALAERALRPIERMLAISYPESVSKSAGSSTARPLTEPSMRRSSPVSTRAGGNSTKVRAPS
ncbi:MAG: quinolinate synthase NadA [Candidatus Omnitrophica bacterium]|nr:quinolinate synthase NadA [Candidatus Omnitrophota bacterium]